MKRLTVITKPPIDTIKGDQKSYIAKVDRDDLMAAFEEQRVHFESLCKSINEEKSNYAYAEGKWSIKELLLHLIDSEKIFAYRALRFARNDATELSSFDEDEFVKQSKASFRTFSSLLEEYTLVRKVTVHFFETIANDCLDKTGTANGMNSSPRILGFMIVGHQAHHESILKERYLI